MFSVSRIGVLFGAWLCGAVATASAELPHVLLIGDEIVEAYAPQVSALLADEALVSFQRTRSIWTGRNTIEEYLGLTPWQVVHFGWGLYDVALTRAATRRSGVLLPSTRLDAYEAAYQKTLDVLIQTDAHLVMATTPPMAESDARYRNDDMARYNAVAKELAHRYDTEVNDLELFAREHGIVPVLAEEGPVHYRPEDLTALAGQVAASIQTALAAPPVSRDIHRRAFSGKVNRADILEVVRAATDWQLGRLDETQTDWKAATFYIGLMAAARITGDENYMNSARSVGRVNDWLLGADPSHADDQAIGQFYLDLYALDGDPAMVQATKARFDEQIAADERYPWTWCDALFMAPPVLARLSRITGDPKYLDYMTREWGTTMAHLYDLDQHLYHRDVGRMERFIEEGRMEYWSRGNGWVLAALARILQVVPKEYPARFAYMALFQEMSREIKDLQGEDGLWRPGLLDPDSYDLPESSGSGLFLYAIAWGVNEGILDQAEYDSTLRRGWSGLVRCVAPSGLVGYVQPAAGGPWPTYGTMATELYGVGAFLLAGSELFRYASE